MKTNPKRCVPSCHPGSFHWLGAVAVLALALAGLGRSQAATPAVQPNHDAYHPGEDIEVTFSGGPGGSKDWIGVYPPDAEPGPVPSTIWRYVDDTQNGNLGLREGTVHFPAGLGLAGDWVVYLLLNDGYTLAATNRFQVVDPSSPLVRPNKRVYAPGEAISIAFTNGPSNPKDWVGVYKVGEVPGGGPTSTIWNYVDGTQNGNEAKDNGSVSFPSGLGIAGDYVAYLLLNDGYDILASETFTVVPPSGEAARILTLTPSDGSKDLPPNLAFRAVLTNGVTQVVTSSVKLELDGVTVSAQVTAESSSTTVSYSSPTLPAPGSSHTWTLSFRDTASPANTVTATSAVAFGQYTNLLLPSPIVFENFDAVAEGALPAGWTHKSYAVPAVDQEDFGDLGSATYARWTVVAADRFTNRFATYGVAENTTDDYRRVLTPNPFNVVNGAVINGPLAQGRFLFGNSGYANSASSQVLMVETPDYNLTGKTNVHVAFYSLWEQNQDSIAAIEYSVDKGAHWLPVAYFLDSNDLITTTNETTGEVAVDVVTTLTTEYSDVARYTDDSGNEVGGTYGAFVSATADQTLAPYIHGRVNDDTAESKRVEIYPLPQADNRSSVRVRFLHSGTDSWYFGIDNFGLYSIGATTSEPPRLSTAREGTTLVLSWPAAATGFVLESSTSLATGSWQPVAGVSGNTHRAAMTGTATYYRLRQ
ncbi:MAG: hypothetical protein IT581_17460 [Verrucomicrobiales bacterium]|nr:hypothetical protein [Verrucomicrobiales bacterium]